MARCSSRTGAWCSSRTVHIGVAPRGLLPWPARFERRFGVVHDGVLDVFEVGHVDEVAAAIRKALAAAR